MTVKLLRLQIISPVLAYVRNKAQQLAGEESIYEGNSLFMALMLLCIVCLVYLLQIFSPLRLNTDSVLYLSLAASFNDGNGFLYHGNELPLPSGYSMMLALLEQVGWGNSYCFTGLNLFFLLLSGVASCRIWRAHFKLSKRSALYCLLLFLLSYVVVKHIALPTSDVVYLGIVISGLSVLNLYERKECGYKAGRLLLLISVLIALAAIYVRMIGVALIPALLFSIIAGTKYLPSISDMREERNLVLKFLSGALGCLIVFLFLISKTKYFIAGGNILFQENVFYRIFGALQSRLLELGGLALNMPDSKIPNNVSILLVLTGLAIACILSFRLWLTRKELKSIDIYMLAYLAIICVWPFQDSRFWMPIIPLLIGYIGAFLSTCPQFGVLKTLVRGYIVAFLLMGIIALAFNTRISLSGSKFPDLYGTGSRRETYRQAFGLPVANQSAVNPEEVLLLKRYGSRTR